MENNVIKLIWQCGNCLDVITSYSNERHNMNYCKCGKSAVDLEEYYQRNMGKIKPISRQKYVNGNWIEVT